MEGEKGAWDSHSPYLRSSSLYRLDNQRGKERNVTNEFLNLGDSFRSALLNLNVYPSLATVWQWIWICMWPQHASIVRNYTHTHTHREREVCEAAAHQIFINVERERRLHIQYSVVTRRKCSQLPSSQIRQSSDPDSNPLQVPCPAESKLNKATALRHLRFLSLCKSGNKHGYKAFFSSATG